MAKKKTIGEALADLFNVQNVSSDLQDFKPSALVLGEPFYTLMEHDEGFLNGRYYTIEAPGKTGAILFFENLPNARLFQDSRDESTNVRSKFYLRGVSKAHLGTLVNFMELGGIEAAFIDDEYVENLKRGVIGTIKIRYLSPGGLSKLAQNHHRGFFALMKRFFWLSRR